MNVLYLSSTVYSMSKSGVSVASTMQYEIVKSILGDECELYKLNPMNRSVYKKIQNFFIYRRYAGMTIEEENTIINKIRNEKFDIVYIDNSLWGFLAERIKNETDSKLYVFFQDIEYFRLKSICKNYLYKHNLTKYFFYKLKTTMAKINEEKVALNADKIMNYNKRDSTLLYKKYKRNSDNIIPIFLINRDIDFDNYNNKLFYSKCNNLLFVGVGSYEPNVFGVRKFIKEVMPHVNANLYIVGKGMEKYKKEFEAISSKVNVLGTVESLDEYYINADAVVIPLYSGGGMKLKTVEALMYGKTIFGTKEAFEGYDVDYSEVGGLCNSSVDFVDLINRYNPQKYNDYSHNIYINEYSDIAVEEAFKIVFTL